MQNTNQERLANILRRVRVFFSLPTAVAQEWLRTLSRYPVDIVERVLEDYIVWGESPNAPSLGTVHRRVIEALTAGRAPQAGRGNQTGGYEGVEPERGRAGAARDRR